VSTSPTAGFRCAAASRLRDEPVLGTATHVRTWLLLEHVGPWGDRALRDARLPDGLGAELQRRAAEHRAKILLIRRYSSTTDGDGLRVFAAHSDPAGPRLEAGRVRDPREVLDVDLGALRRGGTSGLTPYDGSIFCVCTNGRHDACCAELGRPVAKALDLAHPEETWEVSHVGGDRFAANVVVLPHGLYSGRLDPASAIAVAGTHLAGELDLDHLRGHSAHPMAVQAAEIHLRRELGVTRRDDLVLVDRSTDADLASASFVVAGATYDVRVRTVGDTVARLTCKASRDNPAPAYELVSVSRRP
jgi:hypothetical protein